MSKICQFVRLTVYSPCASEGSNTTRASDENPFNRQFGGTLANVEDRGLLYRRIRVVMGPWVAKRFLKDLGSDRDKLK